MSILELSLFFVSFCLARAVFCKQKRREEALKRKAAQVAAAEAKRAAKAAEAESLKAERAAAKAASEAARARQTTTLLFRRRCVWR